MTAISDKLNSHCGAEPRIAIFPGTFDPFTRGHASVVERGLGLFDHIVIAVGINRDKTSAGSVDTRLAGIRRVYAGMEDRVSVRQYSGLTVDFARECGARFILRGIRSVKDFEYERDMADINRQLSGIETVLLYSLPGLAAVSSSVVRELRFHGKDVTAFLPEDSVQ